ncbi:alpha mannosidase-like protein [Agyrium rufum]|nr:alpha mannosidase-like protein [Agyrium rufum]
MVLTYTWQTKVLLRKILQSNTEWLIVLLALAWIGGALAMTESDIQVLRTETEDMFYHGFDNYMIHAFPEDEIKPVSCRPLTRDNNNPAHVELNDPLGNYSLTLIDSLSTLAIIASNPGTEQKTKRALTRFQEGVEALVDLYGDGTGGETGHGARGRGFDVDSKVQVFETVIRGLGGLLSAHLFAVGDLPITGYDPTSETGSGGIRWSRSFSYNGQLLRLAHDLGKRLLPAFSTTTGIPYPRINLRRGVPFYHNSPLNPQNQVCQAEGAGHCETSPPPNHEVTETCTAGAGSLILEFTVLSRLTGDVRFEHLAKRAFWSIWERRSAIGLLGAGIDAESGVWIGSSTGLGAGIDSFFEYAAKSYILLSAAPKAEPAIEVGNETWYFGEPLTASHHDPASYLDVWYAAHDAIKRHLYRGEGYIHPHYVQANIITGAATAMWMDSLSAFFPGLLSMIGHMTEAIQMHLLFTALWSRYSAIPERWSTASGSIEHGLGWWGGRPEFIESTYHLFRATEDPWYLHVGEMTLRDIKRRCWAKCGWSGIQDVRSGEQSDRMESFFLGETTKYLNLLFNPSHPLNTLDSSYVFTTEGHPLLIPKSKNSRVPKQRSSIKSSNEDDIPYRVRTAQCPVPAARVPFTISATAARKDLFHAANLARLQLMPNLNTLGAPLVEFSRDHPSISVTGLHSPTNYTFYPWTIPLSLIPRDGTCAAITSRPQFDITFPPAPSVFMIPGPIHRAGGGILVGGLSGLRLSLIRDVPAWGGKETEGDLFRVHVINGIPLGIDEKVYVPHDLLNDIVNAQDPNFYRIRNIEMLDIVVDLHSHDTQSEDAEHQVPDDQGSVNLSPAIMRDMLLSGVDSSNAGADTASHMRLAFGNLLQQVSSMIGDSGNIHSTSKLNSVREYVSAITPAGIGAAPIPDFSEALSPDKDGNPRGILTWQSVYITGENCKAALPTQVPRDHQIIVMKRGSCSFREKLTNIPTYVPHPKSLQLVIIVSFEPEDGDGNWLTRPLIDGMQSTPGGLPRHNPIPMVMVGGGQRMYDMLRKAERVGIKRRYTIQAQGIDINNLIII